MLGHDRKSVQHAVSKNSIEIPTAEHIWKWHKTFKDEKCL